MNPETFIVLATFNGARYLKEQIASLISQTESRWTLLIRDDGSADGTIEIIQDFSQKDSRIQLLIKPDKTTGTALENFSSLILEAYERGAEYVFCCDQDDVWESEKLALVLKKLQEIEGREKTASLVHHDLLVVDTNLDVISSSFFQMMQLHPSDQQNPQRLITRNEVTGCALACNRSLLEIALPISGQAVMHDWWLALCAGYFGQIAVLPEKLVKYRQHDENTIGAKSFWYAANPFANWLVVWRDGDKELISTVRQAGAFLQSKTTYLETRPGLAVTLKQYSEILSGSRLERLRKLHQLQLWRSHWLLNVVMILRMLFLPRTLIK